MYCNRPFSKSREARAVPHIYRAQANILPGHQYSPQEDRSNRVIAQKSLAHAQLVSFAYTREFSSVDFRILVSFHSTYTEVHSNHDGSNLNEREKNLRLK